MTQNNEWEKLRREIGETIHHEAWCDWESCYTGEGMNKCNCGAMDALDNAKESIRTKISEV